MNHIFAVLVCASSKGLSVGWINTHSADDLRPLARAFKISPEPLNNKRSARVKNRHHSARKQRPALILTRRQSQTFVWSPKWANKRRRCVLLAPYGGVKWKKILAAVSDRFNCRRDRILCAKCLDEWSKDVFYVNRLLLIWLH